MRPPAARLQASDPEDAPFPQGLPRGGGDPEAALRLGPIEDHAAARGGREGAGCGGAGVRAPRRDGGAVQDPASVSTSSAMAVP